MGFRVSLHRPNSGPPMSALGHKQTLRLARIMSAVPSKTDIYDTLIVLAGKMRGKRRQERSRCPRHRRTVGRHEKFSQNDGVDGANVSCAFLGLGLTFSLGFGR